MPGLRPRRRPAARARPPGGQRAGFTLLELMIVVALVSVLGAMALPSLAEIVARHRLQAAAHDLQADLVLARHEALRSGRSAHLSLRPGADWCWALSLDTPVDCAAPPGAGLIKRVAARDHPQVQLLAADPIVLDGQTGRPLQPGAQVLLANHQGGRVRLRLGPLGRAALCADAGAAGQLPRCPPPGPADPGT